MWHTKNDIFKLVLYSITCNFVRSFDLLFMFASIFIMKSRNLFLLPSFIIKFIVNIQFQCLSLPKYKWILKIDWQFPEFFLDFSGKVVKLQWKLCGVWISESEIPNFAFLFMMFFFCRVNMSFFQVCHTYFVLCWFFWIH